MTHKTAFMIATALTVFLVVLIIGVGVRVAQPSITETQTIPVEAAPSVAAASNGAVVESQAQREAAYQEAIRQANQRLAEANQQLQAASQRERTLTDQLQAVAVPDPTTPDPPVTIAPLAKAVAPQYAVSPERGIELALAAAPGSTLARPVEVVNFQGVAAYELQLDRGIIYVDAMTGRILYNGAVSASLLAASSAQALTMQRGEDDDDHQVSERREGQSKARREKQNHKDERDDDDD